MSRLPFHRPPGFLPHRPHERYCRAAHAGPQLTSRSNPGKSIPDGAQRFLVAHSCRASLARRRFAAQPVRREPSRRQTGKPAYSCLAESQKPKQTNGSSHFIRPWTPDFYGKATPLTVIELKRTEDGGHIELQALRYAAMVSTLKFEQAVEVHQKYRASRGLPTDSAERTIREFLDAEDGPVAFSNQVRIILASADFSKEVTSTVLWLNAQGLDIMCCRMRPYAFQGRVLLDVQQVIPLPEAAAFQVAIREKTLAQAAVEASGRDYTRYRVQTSQGEEFTNLPKRRFIYEVVREAIRLGIKPGIVLNAVPWRQSNMFISAPGKLTGEELMATASTKSPTRYFCDDIELFHVEGNTYAMTNQWGPRTEEAVKNIIGVLPENHGLKYNTMA